MGMQTTYSFIKDIVEEMDLNECVKQTVRAGIRTENGLWAFGSNNIKNEDIIECPRVLQNLQSGEGYELCKDVCGQVGHAEIEAINNAKNMGIDIQDATLFLTGHTYCCDNCLESMKIAGIKNVFILDENDKKINQYIL